MEKIQQAIDKARVNRENNHKMQAVSTAANVTDVDKIEYTHTQQIKCPESLQRENRILSGMDHNRYADAFKILSTQVIQRLEDNNWKSLAITSVDEGAGKTTTAINLGISIAKEVEYTVLVIDANLRNPALHQYFGVKPKYGLSDYLTSDLALSDLLIKPENINHFVVLPGGTPVANSSELLASPKMTALVDEIKDRYPKRIIIFDLPAVLGVADTLSFAPSVDAALVVVEDDVTKESDLKDAIELLSVTNVIGTVLNKSAYE